VLIKAILGELLCTFLFIYIVCATAANFERLQTAYNNPVVGALSTGFASVALIYSFADVSGAHFNPAVTFATIVTRKTGLTKGLMYMAAQLLGAVFSNLVLLATFPENFEKGNVAAQVAVVPAIDANIGNAFLTELILTFILVYVIFAVAFDTVDSKNVQVVNTPGGKQKKGANSLTIYTTSGATKAGFAPIAIGFTLGFLCFMGGSVSGGAFNPARVFGSALVGNVWTDHWMYWIADFLGAGMAGYTQKFFATHKN
jgi:glycerol uptake facilitator-like aquaporin